MQLYDSHINNQMYRNRSFSFCSFDFCFETNSTALIWKPKLFRLQEQLLSLFFINLSIISKVPICLYMKKHYFCILFFLLLCMVSEGYSQGLQFYGNEKRISERSSFCVFTDENIPAATGKFKISFEYAVQNAESPGYIFYLKDANGKAAFNLTYVFDNEQGSFMFAQDGKQIYYTCQHSQSKLHGKWMLISLTMDIANNWAEISIGNDKATLEDIGLNEKVLTPQLYFGMYNHILETASFSIRNLTISTDEGDWNFPLNESKGEDVHESNGKITGHVVNPVWLINHSYYWEPLFQSYSFTPSGFVFAPKKQEFYIYNHDSITIYDIYKHTSEQLSYVPEKTTFPIRLGMNFYDEAKDKIYAYELNWSETFIAEMDPEARTWKMINQNDTTLQMHHHSGLFNPQKQQFLFFGGYGNRRYYRSFITYDLRQERWDTLHFSGDEISPRFFAGIAMSPDCKHAYIYGGKGNETGDQNVGIQYYYDLYQLDFETQQIKKLWEHEAPAINHIPARDMILSDDEKYIYLLAYPEYKPKTQLQLYRLSISDGSYVVLGDSIPLTSEEIATNANLYFNREQEEFYCVIQEFEKYGQSTTRIYSLSTPPVSLAAVKYYDRQASDSGQSSVWNYLLPILGLMLVGGLFIVLKRKQLANKAQLQPQTMTSPQENVTTDIHSPITVSVATTQTIGEDEMEEALLANAITTRKNSISLFGPFTAIDKNGSDMTYMFSPKIRHIFLYILVNSIMKDSGVLSSDMNNLFWPDKPNDKIKNLKNVTMNHLRKTLQELEGIELTYQKGYFKLVLTDECYCDYQRFFLLTEGMKRAPLTEDDTAELYNILAQGKYLNTIEDSLFDYSKQQAESFTVSLLSEQIHTFYKNGRNMATIRICNILFAIDPLSDMAMTYAVCTYRRQNKSDRAMQLYGTFTREYQKVMNEDYPITFEEVKTDNIRL